jgi:hypothetical protein
MRYFQQRSERMGSVTADDELDLFGEYLRKGNLPRPVKGKTTVLAGASTIFDDFYFEKNGVRRTGETSMAELSVRNLEKLGRRRAALQTKRVVPKVGRNDLCSCKSGAKFKKCCGRS